LGGLDPAPLPEEYRPYLIATTEALRLATEGASPNTADKLTLEYTAPRSLYEKTDVANLETLSRLRDEAGDERYRAVNALLEGRRLYLAGDERAAAAAYRRGLALWADSEDLRQGLADVYFDWALAAASEGNPEKSREMFEAVLELTPDDEAARANLELLAR
jgi:tetratricopeptide (TPR) repeat protein